MSIHNLSIPCIYINISCTIYVSFRKFILPTIIKIFKTIIFFKFF
nr:MAG TPA: hypothetical protein [Caudoviricetes sp.]